MTDGQISRKQDRIADAAWSPRPENRERTGQDHSSKEIQLCKPLVQWQRHGQRRQTHVEGVHAAARDDLEEFKRAHPEQMQKVI